MLKEISETQPTVGKLGIPETGNAVSSSETPGNTSGDQKHLRYQKQASSNTMKVNATNDDSFQVVTKRRQQKQQSKLDDKVQKAAGAKTRKVNRKTSGANTEIADPTQEGENTPRSDRLSSCEDEENSQSDEPSQIGTFSKKKMEYMTQEIKDRSGTYKFDADPATYKKARKRLQNRESAVRSRMKKKQEMDVLEEQVKLLSEQKAAMEAQNEELKRQNKYWEDLFSKQQAVLVQQPIQNNNIQQPHSQLSNHGSDAKVEKRVSMHESKSIMTQQTHDFSNLNEVSSDHSYESLEMTRAEFMKRQKTTYTDVYGNTSQKTPQAQKDNLPIMRNISFGGHVAALSEGKLANQEEQKDLFGEGNEIFNVDDMLIDRRNGPNNGGLNFFGLACMFGAVGMASFMTASPVEGSSGISNINTGGRMVGTEKLQRGEAISITNQVNEENYHAEQSPFQIMQIAFELIMQALMTMPVTAYISFALSLVFMLLWLNPFNLVTGEEKPMRQKVRKSSRTQSSTHRRHRQKSGSTQQQNH